MITLNNKKFAETEAEFIDSLFASGGTCVGYAKKNKSSVTLLDHNKQKIGVINKHGVLGKATKQLDGKYWYSYGTIEQIGGYDNYMQSVKEPAAIINALFKNQSATENNFVTTIGE